MFQLVNDNALKPEPNSNVVCKVEQLIPFPQFFQWVAEAFPIPSQASIDSLIKTKDNVKLELKAVDIRNGKALSIQLGNVEQHNTCKVLINTHSMELASDLVQDLLGGFLHI